MTESLTIGMLGYRFMGKAHSNALARLPMFFPDAPEIERHTLIGRDEEALAEAAGRFGFAHTATDWANCRRRGRCVLQSRAEPSPCGALDCGA